jgi:hypothetical protein
MSKYQLPWTKINGHEQVLNFPDGCIYRSKQGKIWIPNYNFELDETDQNPANHKHCWKKMADSAVGTEFELDLIAGT